MGKLKESPENEFWFHVSNQNEIPIAGESMAVFDFPSLRDIVSELPQDDNEAYHFLVQKVLANPEIIKTLRSFVGVTDKRLYLELSYRCGKQFLPGTRITVSGDSVYDVVRHPLSFFIGQIEVGDEASDRMAEIVVDFMFDKNLLPILRTLSQLNDNQIEVIVNNLIVPKELQQQDAKRRGHGAEFELAKFLHEIGCDILPEDRYLTPIGGHDPNVDKDKFEICPKKIEKTLSCDIIILENNRPRVLIQSLIHTSDPGQYGVNKSDETIEFKNDLTESNKKYRTQKQLWGLIDGVGFCENKTGTLNKMIRYFDTFVQLKTLYKAALRLHSMGLIKVKAIRFDMSFYDEIQARDMYEMYGSPDIRLITDANECQGCKEIKAGVAWIYI